MNYEAIGQAVGGTIRGIDKGGLAGWLRSIEGENVVLTLRKAGRRTSKQNAYLWSVNTMIAARLREDGHRFTPEQIHEMLKMKFAPVTVVIESTGEILTAGGSSKVMSRKEFGDYVDAIILWAWETLRLEIPLPNTQTELKLTA